MNTRSTRRILDELRRRLEGAGAEDNGTRGER
jgi:hypothetical protein